MAIFWTQGSRGQDEIEVVGGQPRAVARPLPLLPARAVVGRPGAARRRCSWSPTCCFATAYHWTGGVANAHGFVDEFFLQRGDDGHHRLRRDVPRSTRAAHAIMTVEALAQIFLHRGHHRPGLRQVQHPARARAVRQHPTIGPYDGAPTLQFRIGNERDSRLLEAVIRVVLMRTEKTKEGVTHLPHARSQARARPLTGAVAHRGRCCTRSIRRACCYRRTPESLERDEVELILTLSGTDELSAQMLYAQTALRGASEIRWGARHADMLSERPDGRLRLDMRPASTTWSRPGPPTELPCGEVAEPEACYNIAAWHPQRAPARASWSSTMTRSSSTCCAAPSSRCTRCTRRARARRRWRSSREHPHRSADHRSEDAGHDRPRADRRGAQAASPDLQAILLTAYTEPEDLIAAINEGRVYRYVTKPWNTADLVITVKNALEAVALRRERDGLLGAARAAARRR